MCRVSMSWEDQYHSYRRDKTPHYLLFLVNCVLVISPRKKMLIPDSDCIPGQIASPVLT